jgi:hypothetical protein
MNLMTFYDRNEWVYVDEWLLNQRSVPTTDAGRELVKTLREGPCKYAAVNPLSALAAPGAMVPMIGDREEGTTSPPPYGWSSPSHCRRAWISLCRAVAARSGGRIAAKR